MRARTLISILTLAIVSAGITVVPAPTPAKAAPPTMTRAEIIARADTAVGNLYGWGRESWTPNPDISGRPGPDCSGYTLKCWEVPRTLLYQEEDTNSTISPRYTSHEFYHCRGPWVALSSRSQLKQGDALVTHNGSSGHVVIYAGGDAWNSPIIYEAPGTGKNIARLSRYLGSDYKPIRRNSVVDSGIILDNPTAKSVGGTDLASNWTRSTSTPGYYGHDYQVRAATSATAWARWTPRLPSSGYYNVYMRWTSHPNRASNAKVHINTPTGQVVRYVNQRTAGGSWNLIGRYRFNAGYNTGSGSVSIFATGANGYVVADGVWFSPTN